MKASVFRGTEGSLKSRVLSFEREHLYPLEPGSQLFFFLYHEQRPNFRLGCFHPIFFVSVATVWSTVIYLTTLDPSKVSDRADFVVSVNAC